VTWCGALRRGPPWPLGSSAAATYPPTTTRTSKATAGSWSCPPPTSKGSSLRRTPGIVLLLVHDVHIARSIFLVQVGIVFVGGSTVLAVVVFDAVANTDILHPLLELPHGRPVSVGFCTRLLARCHRRLLYALDPLWSLLEVCTAEVRRGVIVGAVLLVANARLALFQRVNGTQLRVDAERGGVLANPLLHGWGVLGILVSAELVLPAEAVWVIITLLAVDLGVLGPLVLRLLQSHLLFSYGGGSGAGSLSRGGNGPVGRRLGCDAVAEAVLDLALAGFLGTTLLV